MKITQTSTGNSIACSKLQNDGCEHCGASYGHTIVCPLINRNVAEARSAVITLNKPDADWLKALKIGWEDAGEEARRTR